MVDGRVSMEEQFIKELHKWYDNRVTVVRCKDCARGTLETEGAAKGYINCPYQGYGELHPQDWYCADGIRKGSDESE